MPTKTEREYYRMGFLDGQREAGQHYDMKTRSGKHYRPEGASEFFRKTTPKRKLNSWQKFVKANSKKRKFRFKDGKLKLKSMGIAYRKTAAYKRSKK